MFVHAYEKTSLRSSYWRIRGWNEPLSHGSRYCEWWTSVASSLWARNSEAIPLFITYYYNYNLTKKIFYYSPSMVFLCLILTFFQAFFKLLKIFLYFTLLNAQKLFYLWNTNIFINKSVIYNNQRGSLFYIVLCNKLRIIVCI